MAANEDRGEVEIELEGASYPLRPSFAAIRAAERATGLALSDLTAAAQRGNLPLDHLGPMVLEFMRAGAEDPTAMKNFKAERIAELVFEAGVLKANLILYALLMAALTGGVTATGEAKAAVETGTTTAA